MSSHLSPSQVELLDEYDRGEWSDEDFTALALEAGFSHQRIDSAIKEHRLAEAAAAEDIREFRQANAHFSIGL